MHPQRNSKNSRTPLSTALRFVGFIFKLQLLCSTIWAAPQIKLERVFPKLSFNRPIFLTVAPGDPRTAYVLEQRGVVRAFDWKTGRSWTVLDLTDRVSRAGNEEGLLGLAFHPGFTKNRIFYLYYSARKPRRSVIASYRMTKEPNTNALKGSAKIVLEVGQPYGNHNGGMLAFGPDGALYIGLGDGGAGGDPHNHGQNLGTLLGSILRIDVDRKTKGRAYAIPADNPFVKRKGARAEIYAYGLRNPWRFSFDRSTGELYAGDVGQNAEEEVDLIRRGGNYGWNIREGRRSYRRSTVTPSDLIEPLLVYNRKAGASITGGYVYRGRAVPELYGTYLYADFSSGHVWGARIVKGKVIRQERLLSSTGHNISSFGEDHAGELYICSFSGGIHRITKK